MPIPRVQRTHLLDTQLFFLDEQPQGCWEKFRELADDLARTGLARVVFASPWWPTLPGTDRYTDQLW